MRSTPSFRIVSSILALALVAAPSPVLAGPASTAKKPASEAEEAEPAEASDDDGEPAGEDDEEAEPAGDEDGAEPEEEEEEEPEPEPEPVAEPAPEELMPSPEDERPDEPMIAGKPRKGKGLMIAGGTVLGVGIVSTVVFGLVSNHCSYDGPLQCKHQNDRDFLIPLGASVTLLGAMMLAVGIGYHFHYKKWERWAPGQDDKKGKRSRRAKTALVPAMSPDGVGLSWSGRF